MNETVRNAYNEVCDILGNFGISLTPEDCEKLDKYMCRIVAPVLGVEPEDISDEKIFEKLKDRMADEDLDPETIKSGETRGGIEIREILDSSLAGICRA